MGKPLRSAPLPPDVRVLQLTYLGASYLGFELAPAIHRALAAGRITPEVHADLTQRLIWLRTKHECLAIAAARVRNGWARGRGTALKRDPALDRYTLDVGRREAVELVAGVEGGLRAAVPGRRVVLGAPTSRGRARALARGARAASGVSALPPPRSAGTRSSRRRAWPSSPALNGGHHAARPPHGVHASLESCEIRSQAEQPAGSRSRDVLRQLWAREPELVEQRGERCREAHPHRRRVVARGERHQW